VVQDWLGPVVGAAIAAGFVVNSVRDWHNDDIPWYRVIGSTSIALAMLAVGFGMRGHLIGPMLLAVVMVPLAVIPTRLAVRMFAPRKALEQLAREGETWALPASVKRVDPSEGGETGESG